MLRQALESVLAHMLESASPVRLSSARKRNSPPPPPHQHVIPKLALAGAAHAGSNGLLHRLCDARQVEGAAAAGLAGSAGCGVGAAVGRRRQARGRPRSKAAAALNCPSAASPARLDQRCLRLAALLGLFDRTPEGLCCPLGFPARCWRPGRPSLGVGLEQRGEKTLAHDQSPFLPQSAVEQAQQATRRR